MTPWSGLRNPWDQNHAYVYFFIFPWLAFVCGFSLLNPSVAYAGEHEENSVSGNSGRHVAFSGQRLRMRKAESCKAQILETRVDFLETRIELLQKQVRWPHYFILKLGSVDGEKTNGKKFSGPDL